MIIMCRIVKDSFGLFDENYVVGMMVEGDREGESEP